MQPSSPRPSAPDAPPFRIRRARRGDAESLAPLLREMGYPHGPGAQSMDEHADDVVALLDELGLDSAVVGGVSMGGYVTFAVLRRASPRWTSWW